MADPALKISAELTGLEKSAQRALANIERNTKIRVQVDDRASLPLGRISRNASELESSLDAATSRVIAFGAAAAVFAGIAKTFDNLVTSIVEVEESLAKVNVNFGATEAQLKSFGKEVFAAARNTAKTFNEAAKASEELARQGLGTEETIKRLNDALILSRRAGIDSAEAVNTLTAAFNSFQSAGLDTTQIINKLVAVDTRFAVSTKDLSDAISRAASTAQEAGVSFDEFLGIVTAVQQTTARGGAVIGNALKTIFTRVQAAPQTLKALEDLGVAITDSSGAFTSAGDRLRQYAQIRQSLSEGDRAYYDRLISGTQQINILAAALNDLGKANSVAAEAQKISSQATDEAIAQNQELNKTLKSVISQTGTNFTQIFSQIGGDSGGALKNILSGFNSFLESVSQSEGAIRGLSNVLTTGFVAGLFIAAKVGFEIFQNLRKALAAVAGLNSAQNVRLQIEKQIAAITANATSDELRRLNSANSLAERRAAYLSIEQRVTAELAKQAALSSSLAQSFVRPYAPKVGGVLSDFQVKPARNIPGFADPLRTAVQREIASGVPANQIYIDKDPRVKSASNPMGLLVANKIDEPLGGFQGVNNAIKQGRNPKTNGIVPNFAEFDNLKFYAGARQTGFTDFNLPPDRSKELRKLFIRFRQSRDIGEVQSLAEQIKSFSSSSKLTTESVREIDSKIKAQLGRVERIRKIYRSGVNPFGERSSGANEPSSPDPGPSGQRGFDPSERTRQVQTTGQRAALTLQRERAAGASEELRKRAANLLAQGIVPNEKEILSIRKKVETLAVRQLRDDPEFSGFIEKGKFTKDAPPELQRLFKDRVARNLSSFDNALDAARERATGVRDQRLISRSFDRFGVGFSGKRDVAIRDRLLERVTPENRQLVESAFRSRQERRAGRIQTASLGAAFLAPLAAGFVPQGAGGTAGGIASGGASGALQGAGFGALLGPVGAGVGAVVGGLVGSLNKLKKSTEEYSKVFETSLQLQGQNVDSLSQVVQLQEELNKATDKGTIKTLLGRQSSALGDLSPSLRKSVLGAGGDVDRLRQILIEEQDRGASLGRNVRAAQSALSVGNNFLGRIGFARADNDFGASDDLSRQLQNIISPELAGRVAGSSRQLLSSAFATEPRNIPEEDLKLLQSFFDELAKTAPEFREISVNAVNFRELARGLLQGSVNAKKLTKEQQELNSIQEKLISSNRNLRSFSALTREGANPLRQSAFLGQNRFGLAPQQRTQEIQDRALLESISLIQESLGDAKLPSKLEDIQKEATGRLGKVGIINALEALVTGALGRSSESLGLTGEFGARNDFAVQRTAQGLVDTPGIAESTKQQAIALLEIAKEKGFQLNNKVQAFAPGQGLGTEVSRDAKIIKDGQDIAFIRPLEIAATKISDEVEVLSGEVSKLKETLSTLDREVRIVLDIPEQIVAKFSEEDKATIRDIILKQSKLENDVGVLSGNPKPPIIQKPAAFKSTLK